ncbi:hypothetical protein QBC40DRAFT_293095 [Triangularia verruculosa]|uniref:Ubiquitin 3 binding protein But2 C-terminal domain-containing protein n=1 Tax=Triangularia verruculosa TaxID=2587418 RepID=A0AAN6XTP3_9PEZI|nr:hypothetical protein QBC40DRAFT_293095 [Triangularia verruculosa]
MQFSTFFFTLSAFAGLTLAAPTSDTTCQRVLSFERGFRVINSNLLYVSHNQTLTFTLPANAPGPCTLIADFPAHFSIDDDSVANGGAPSPINVFDVDDPARGSLVGTFSFPSELPDREIKKATKLTINSFACREKMTFVLTAVNSGAVMFIPKDNAGLFVEYGC